MYDYDPLSYSVRPIDFKTAREFVVQNHYSKGMTNNTSGAFGLFDKAFLIGVLSFSTPCSENVRGSVFGQDWKDRVTELSRLVILDVTPPNAESYFIARCLNQLKQDRPDLWAVVSFADPSAGHLGIIYQASNGLYYGQSTTSTAYLDTDGRLRHRRQCGRNISVSEAISRGWTPSARQGKHRYCFFLPDNRRHRNELLDRTLLARRPYPKGSTNNGLLKGQPA